jgi:hypothetical protein
MGFYLLDNPPVSTMARKVSVVRATGTGGCFFFADADRTASFTIEDVGI